MSACFYFKKVLPIFISAVEPGPKQDNGVHTKSQTVRVSTKRSPLLKYKILFKNTGRIQGPAFLNKILIRIL